MKNIVHLKTKTSFSFGSVQLKYANFANSHKFIYNKI